MKKKKKETEKKADSIVSLKETAYTLSQEIFALRSELAINRKLDKPHLLKAKKRERARVLGAITAANSAQIAKEGN